MLDHRRETTLARVFRALWFAAGAIVAIALLYRAGSQLGDPASALARYGEPAVAPRVFVRGTVRQMPDSPVPAALCSVRHERYEQCGKNRCWRVYEGMTASFATIDVDWSSAPLDAPLSFGTRFRIEPAWPPIAVTDAERSKTWKEIAQRARVGFTDASFNAGANDRIVESCLNDGEEVFVEACVSSSEPHQLEPCPGATHYGIVPGGDPQIAIDASANDIAFSVAGAFCALLVGSLALLRARSRLAEGLEDRAAPHRRGLGAAWALLAVPPIAALVNALLHASRYESTWSTGRGGFVLGITALTLWTLFALHRALHRTRTLAALAPVLATPRSLLAEASGTVELAVRARLRNDGTRAFIGDDVVAFSELCIRETYKSGKHTSSVDRLVLRANDELDVVDESGDGVLDLSHAILDVELRRATMPELSPRYAERGVTVERHPNHVSYVIEERVIRADEPLYVFGHVSGLDLRSGGQGYRSVRGAPKLGGADLPPVLVHAGDEQGLVASLAAQARSANGMAAAAGFAAVLLAGMLGYLAWL